MAIINAVADSRQARARAVVGAVLAASLLALGTACSEDDSDGNSQATMKVSGPVSTRPAPSSSEGVDFWAGKADVAIFLCNRTDPKRDGCANGEVTNAERDAIKADLDKLLEVEQVYYESKQEAFVHFKEQNKDSPLADTLTADQLPESFRVKLTDPTKEAIISSAFSGRPGVADVIGPSGRT